MVRAEPEPGCSVRVGRGLSEGPSDPAPNHPPPMLDARRAPHPPGRSVKQVEDKKTPCFGPRVGGSDADRGVRILGRATRERTGTGGPS